FCNAGFSIFSNSFEDYKSHWGINTTLMVLIILGGLGFLVITEIGFFIRRKIKRISRLSLHTKLVLVTSGILILAGFLVILIEELINKNNHFSFGTTVLTSLFQSVSTRTAGFNTVNYNFLSSASLFIMILLMFIGASPGSTGGGIKTTSVGVVYGHFRSLWRGKKNIDLFYRNIPLKAIEKAFLVITISFVLISVFYVLLLTLEPDKDITALLFETVSAFGTVGLSMGITPEMSLPSKLLLSLTMFIGRIGPLTLLLALSKRESRAMVQYSEERIMIG
ncbi:MAG: hypothetical protein GY940_47335, partial [bacterium]|nr:hypothetical protein [bacterium]